MDLIWTIYGVVVFTFFIALIARFVLEWVQVLSRSWRPSTFRDGASSGSCSSSH